MQLHDHADNHSIDPHLALTEEMKTWAYVDDLDAEQLGDFMGCLLRERIQEKGLEQGEAATLLGVAPSTVSRWLKAGQRPISRAGAIKVDNVLPLDLPFSMGQLRDVYVVKLDRNAHEGNTAVATSITEDVVLQTLSSCSFTDAVHKLTSAVEPMGDGRRLCYALFSAADPIAAERVGASFFAEAAELDSLGHPMLLTADHFKGHWDVGFRYTVDKNIDAEYVFEELEARLADPEHNLFPVSGVRKTRFTEPRGAGFGKLVAIRCRASDIPGVLQDISQQVSVHLPPPVGYEGLRIERNLVYIDFHQVDQADDREFLIDQLGKLVLTPPGLEIAPFLESCNLGVGELILEFLLPCGSTRKLVSFNARFEEDINTHLTVQKYNLGSYKHTNYWAHAGDLEEHRAS